MKSFPTVAGLYEAGLRGTLPRSQTSATVYILYVLLAFFISVASQSLSASAATETPATDIATRARQVFAAKCTLCHGSDLINPRGRFGYVLDLQRVAANPEMVIPGEPAESELWSLVSHNEMPPPDSPRGPLTDAQKVILKKWIEAGAPDVAPPTAATNTFDSLASRRPRCRHRPSRRPPHSRRRILHLLVAAVSSPYCRQLTRVHLLTYRRTRIQLQKVFEHSKP